MSKIKFKRDTAFRKQFFVPDSFAHLAKMDAQLLIWIVEHYTEAGETIIDPMAGSGTTMLACTLGRNVVLVELEEKFCKMMLDNWAEVRMRPQLGSTVGNCQIIQGDARQLEGLVDKIVTSPPYTSHHYADKKFIDKYVPRPHTGFEPDNLSNIGNLPYGQIDKIVTSPPYESQISDKTDLDSSRRIERLKKAGYKITKDYTKGGNLGHWSPFYSSDNNNIGNLKSQSYLEAMLQVYQQCHKVLKDGGLMILVTKNFIRNKQVIRLDTDTIKLCEQAGFKFIERHYRKLPSQSFWRVIYHQKHPEVEQILNEDVLVFSKPCLGTLLQTQISRG